jgi:hypothetical protein
MPKSEIDPRRTEGIKARPGLVKDVAVPAAEPAFP